MRDFSRSKKYNAFYEVALQNIYTYGYKGTTLRNIAQTLDCDVSNIYNFINSKHQLLEEILFTGSQYFNHNVESIKNANLGSIDKLKHICSFYIRTSYEYPREVHILNSEWKSLKAEKQLQFLKAKKALELQIKEILIEGQNSNDILPIDVNLQTHLFLSTLRWFFAGVKEEIKDRNPYEIELQVWQYISNGLAIKQNP